mmetsp:Transcript_518/g.857  ORF Transcript_518/g.857 Transcript_518/m.857 type:complete len:616 (+) Transcript_518:58-1905(+)
MTRNYNEGSSSSNAVQRRALSKANKTEKGDEPSSSLSANEESSAHKASPLTIKGFLFRLFLSIILILFLAGMVSSSPSLYDIDSSSSRTTDGSSLLSITTSIVKQGMISLAWSLVNWMPPIMTNDDFRLELQQKCWTATSAFSPPSLNNKKTSFGASSSVQESSSTYELEIPRIDIPDLLQSYHRLQQNSQNGGADDANPIIGSSFAQFVSDYLIKTYGTDWRERPLLLEGLLDYNNNNIIANTAANSDTTNKRRRLSLQGLLELDQVIPYFEQAHKPGTLTPTAKAPVSEIVQGMLNGQPYKIGSQLIIQEHPDWMQELTGKAEDDALLSQSSSSSADETTTTGNLLSFLFGNHFRPEDVEPGRFLPATTTVPVFVANHHLVKNSEQHDDDDDEAHENEESASQQEEDGDSPTTTTKNNKTNQKQHQQHITTGLHCEPIGNVAFQMEGSKEWTLVSPKYSAWLEPSLAADGRAFFASSLKIKNDDGDSSSAGTTRTTSTLSQVLNQRQIPHWTAVTGPSDALWVPTWTWHRVDYRLSSKQQANKQDTCADPAVSASDKKDAANICSTNANPKHALAIGGSIFHFRAWDFLRRNPLYAVLIVPALIKELAGVSTQ